MAIGSWRSMPPARQTPRPRARPEPHFLDTIPMEEYNQTLQNNGAIHSVLKDLRANLTPEQQELLSARDKARQNRLKSGQKAKVE